jgi:FMN phosphatase YigB (HAD superfamily)
VAVSFDLFGTLVTPARSPDPGAAIATELAARDVVVPNDWAERYRTQHVAVEDGAELPLTRHVRAALDSAGVAAPRDRVARAVLDAFDVPVETHADAQPVLDAAARVGPVALCSNCSVAGLVERTVARADVDPSVFDAVVTSVDCGWRKPDARAFEAVASALSVPPDALCHVGDDPQSDGGVTRVGGTPILLDDHGLAAVPAHLEGTECR